MDIARAQPDGNKYMPVFWAGVGAIGIAFLFYAVQALGMQSLSGPFYFFLAKWYFITPLIVLFSFQIGLWSAMREHAKKAGKMVAASGGVSTGAMIACCMHNFVGLLPIIGLSVLAIFFSTYQTYVFLVSISFSAGGAAYMWSKYHATCNVKHVTY